MSYHEHYNKQEQSNQRYQQAKRITLIGAIINALLSVFKIVFGFIGQSQALIADGIHSLADLVTDFMVLFASKASNQAPDEDHPYGHDRIETLATVGLSIFLIIVGLGIVGDAVESLMTQNFQMPTLAVIIVAGVSVLANEFLFRITLRTANNINSELLKSNAWHSRGDALSSLIVLIGAACTMLGFHYMDSVAAIIVAALIVKMGAKMAWVSIRELIDTGMSEEKKAQIIECMKNTPGVVAVHEMRSRSMAGQFFVDVHVEVDSHISVSEGHYIADKAYAAIKQNVDNIKDITVHIDPEDDAHGEKMNLKLPTRNEVVNELSSYWHSLLGYDDLSSMRLDYLGGKLYIQLLLPLSLLNGDIAFADEIQKQYAEVVECLDYLGAVKVTFH
jgi:cation diffusion facilitator family transporter